MVDEIIARIKAAPFVHQQFKDLLVAHYQLAPRAKELQQTQAFKHIILAYTKLFPEDARTVGDIFDFELVQTAAKRPGRAVVIRTDIFSSRKGKGDANRVKPCDDCPGGEMVELIDRYLEDDDTEEFSLPDELFDEAPAGRLVTSLVNVKDRESMEQFLGVGSRSSSDIIAAIRSYFKTNNINYDGKARSLAALLEEFYVHVVEPKK